MNKILIKAQIISLIDSLQTNYDINNISAQKDIMSLKEANCPEFIIKILVNELFKSGKSDCTEIILFLINELIPKDLIEDYVFTLLKSPLDDSKKYRLISVLRTIGKVMNYDMLTEFMSDPEKFINEDTRMLIQNSLVNPELQIDFIDFLHALNSDDRVTLLDSLVDDYGNNTDPTNLLIPLLYLKPESEFFFKIIELLTGTKSKKALDALVLLSKQYTKSPQTVAKIKKSINLLKLSCKKCPSVNMKPIFDSKFYKCYISFPDGLDNFGLIFSRKRTDTSIQMFSVAVNMKNGILDAFGFNEILHYDFEQIVNKFYHSEKRIEISPEIAKTLLQYFEEKNIANLSPISYEYICWKILLDDVETVSLDEIFSVDNETEFKYEKDFIDQLLNIATFVQSWFYDENNITFKNIIDDIYKKSLINKTFSATDWFQIVDNACSLFTTETEQTVFSNKLCLSALLCKNLGNYQAAGILYSICSDKTMMKKFVRYIIKKSIYYYFKSLKTKFSNDSDTSNVCILKTAINKQKFTSEFIENILLVIKENLVKDE